MVTAKYFLPIIVLHSHEIAYTTLYIQKQFIHTNQAPLVLDKLIPRKNETCIFMLSSGKKTPHNWGNDELLGKQVFTSQ